MRIGSVCRVAAASICWMAATTFVFILIAGAPATAHEGHDHVTPLKPDANAGAPRAEAQSELFELVATAAGGALTIYIDRFDTNEPVTDANVSVETPQGAAEASATKEGTFRLEAPWTQKPGHYDLILTVTAGDKADIIPIALDIPDTAAPEAPAGAATQNFLTSPARIGLYAGILVAVFVVGAAGGFFAGRRRAAAALAAALLLLAPQARAHEGDDHGEPAQAKVAISPEAAQRLPDGSVFVPKSTQRILGIRTVVANSALHRRSIELPGRIIPDPAASGLVQAAVGGRLSPPEGGFPRLGTRVRKGDVLAYVTPPMQAIDASDMRQRQGELDQQISIVQRRLARLEMLTPSGAAPRFQLEETKLELEGLKDRRASLDRARLDPEALIAPVDGVVADGTPVAGQMAQPNAIVFQIIDPAKLWVEALSYEILPVIAGASARAGGKDVSLAFRGAGLADRNQAIPVHFAVASDPGTLRAGQFVTVLAQAQAEQDGIAVPRGALVRTNAGDVVFEHVSAERFEPRLVRAEPLDAERVLIAQGLASGRRIATQGAELLAHIR